MKKILLPTDFSENALNAIDYALQLFKDEKCAFFILNTYTPMIYNYEYQLNADQYMMEAVDMVKKNSEVVIEVVKNIQAVSSVSANQIRADAGGRRKF